MLASPGVAAEELALAEGVLGHATGPAQVAVTRTRSLLLRAPDRGPDAREEIAVAVAAWADGHVGRATADVDDEDALRDALARAETAAAAAAGAGREDTAHPGPPPELEVAPAHDGFDPGTARLEPEEGERALGAALESAPDASAKWSAADVTTAVAATTGLRAGDRSTRALLEVVCRGADGRTGWASAAGVAVSAIDAGATAQRALAKLGRGEPVALPGGVYPVVFEPAAVAQLLRFLGAVAFNGLAHATGRGALVGRLGTRVASAAVNLSDSPRYPRTLPRAFDGEGVPKRPIPLVQDGVAHAVVHDRRSAALAGAAGSTGHALAPGGAESGPEPRNLVLVGGGAAGVEELAARVGRGLLVSRLVGLETVDERDARFTATSADGTFLIDDGRIAGRAEDVAIADSALRILGCVEALSAEQRLVGGVVCPALRAAEVPLQST